jgi:hypothetical protein
MTESAPTAAEYAAEHGAPPWGQVLGTDAPDPFAGKDKAGRRTSSAERLARAVERGRARREAELEALARRRRREDRAAERRKAATAGMSSAEIIAARAGHWGEQS